jgi:hypothetical protein
MKNGLKWHVSICCGGTIVESAGNGSIEEDLSSHW